jgi:hypothetical protein
MRTSAVRSLTGGVAVLGQPPNFGGLSRQRMKRDMTYAKNEAMEYARVHLKGIWAAAL